MASISDIKMVMELSAALVGNELVVDEERLGVVFSVVLEGEGGMFVRFDDSRKSDMPVRRLFAATSIEIEAT